MYAPGNFSFILDPVVRANYEDMYAAITKAAAWEWLKEDPGSSGFMFNKSDMLRRIHANLANCVGHSNASFSMYMRQMHYIASNGWDDWVAVMMAPV